MADGALLNVCQISTYGQKDIPKFNYGDLTSPVSDLA